MRMCYYCGRRFEGSHNTCPRCCNPGRAVLFDKMDIPVIARMTEESAWKAITAWEDWMYSNADSFSEVGYDNALRTVSSLRAEYYTLFDK
jgi:hypothetical protein